MERSPSVPLSRGLKIEDLASKVPGEGSPELSKLFSANAFVHAVSGSVGGNVAMLGQSCADVVAFTHPALCSDPPPICIVSLHRWTGTAFYPLDQLVIRAQAATDKGKSVGPFRAMADVIASEGVSGLYRGLNSTLFTLFVANFIYFYAFHLMRAYVARNKHMRKIGKV